MTSGGAAAPGLIRMADRLDTATEQNGKGDLAAPLAEGDTWTVPSQRRCP
ncbi:hypothetical protein [Streptomyces sp. SD15]